MEKLYVKQKVFSLKDRFTVMDEKEKIRYSVVGSFLKIPKEFHVVDKNEKNIAVIKKKIFRFFPEFSVEIGNQKPIFIKKEFSFIKDRYTLSSGSIEVQGNWWDMDFEMRDNGIRVGSVHKKWLSWGDTYEIQIDNKNYEKLLVSLVIAIDCVKADARRRNSASN